MAGPQFSIVIPTRSRAVYLASTLATVAEAVRRLGTPAQVVVADNASDDETEEVVRCSPLDISYSRAAKRLSMRMNFERALDLAKGDYVLFLGDDDGLAPDGLRQLSEILAARPVDIVNWRLTNYTWPGEGDATQAHLTLKYRSVFGPVRWISPKTILAKFLAGTARNHRAGGNIYHGLVSRRLIDRARIGNDGVYFGGISPDVYASITNLALTDDPLAFVRHPISLGGTSPRSNGEAGRRAQSTGPSGEYQRFIDEVESDPIRGKIGAEIPSAELHLLDAVDSVCRDHGLDPDRIDKARWGARVTRELGRMGRDQVERSADAALALLGSRPVVQPRSDEAGGGAPSRRSPSRISATQISLSGNGAPQTIAEATGVVGHLLSGGYAPLSTGGLRRPLHWMRALRAAQRHLAARRS
ncbi:MAG: glycosyltransferase [Pseudomonadota bacterium]